MSATSEAPADAGAAGGPRPSRGSRWRAALRLARRQVRRDWRTSLLVTALVALPLAAVAAGAVSYDSHQPGPGQDARAEVGKTAAWLQIVGAPDPTRQQWLDDPSVLSYSGSGSEDEPPTSVSGVVPAGTELLTLTQANAGVETRGGTADLSAVIGDVGDQRLDGRLQLIEGARPLGTSDAAISPGALERLGAHVGDTLTLTDPRATFTISGVMKVAKDPEATTRIFLPNAPSVAALADAPTATTWFSIGWAPATADEVFGLNHEGFIAYAPKLAADPGKAGSAGTGARSELLVLSGLTAAGLAFSAYLVALLAGAALSVSARRQQQQLAIAASVGAERRDVFLVILLQGAALGLTGGAVGIAAGVGIGAWLNAATATGAVNAPWGLHVPWLALSGLLIFSVAVGLLAALFPARNASRQNVLAALRGTRRPVILDRARPVWGLAMIVLGVALTAIGALAVLWTGSQPQSEATAAISAVAIGVIIAGPIVMQLGVILAGHWLITLIAKGLGRIGVGARVAGRDAAANPSRIVPAFGAIAACAFLASAAFGAIGTVNGADARGWAYSAPLGDASVFLYADDAQPPSDAETAQAAEAARGAAQATGASHIAEVGQLRAVDSGAPGHAPDEIVPRPVLQRYVDCTTLPDGDPGLNSCAWPALAALGQANGYSVGIDVVAADDLAAVLGGGVSAGALDVYRHGGAVVTDDRWLNDDDEFVVNEWEFRQLDAAYEAMGKEPLTPHDSTAIPGALAHPPFPLAGHQVFVAPDTADALGLDYRTGMFILSFDGTPSRETLDRLSADLDAAQQRLIGAGGIGFGSSYEQGPPDSTPWYALVGGGTAVLVIGAAAIAVGLSRLERRGDDATLAAVGASPRLRRSVSFWQGLIVAGLGCVTGAVAGLLPVAGTILASRGKYAEPFTLLDAPWPLIAALAVGLPLLLAAASWLVPPRRADLTRRAAIA